MISLDLTRKAAADTSKLYLMKGTKVSVCHHCLKSVDRQTMLRCNECRHNFCSNCLDACRCYTKGGFRMGLGFLRRPQQTEQARHLALVSSAAFRP